MPIITYSVVTKVDVSFNEGSNFSFEASLTMYTNKTINPPRKIKNKIYENHDDFEKIQIEMHVVKVWIIIIHKIVTGCDDIIKTAAHVNIKIKIKKISEFSLLKY